MLRAISAITLESPAFERLASAAVRRDFGKHICVKKYSSTSHNNQTVLKSEEKRTAAAPAACAQPPAGPASYGAPPPRRAWALAAAALAAAASVGGVYFYRKLSDEDGAPEPAGAPVADAPAAPDPAPCPADGADLPRRVHFLLVGGGTASFAAMRALRAARPDATVLLVGEETLPPYMRPPLSKELWREPAAPADDALHQLSFRQWNGKRRPLLYEPPAFYTPCERLAQGGGGAAAARGWRVARLHVERHEAVLHAPGQDPVTISYERCLVAPGLRPRRLEALRAAREAGRALCVRSARDAARLARLVDAADTRHVLVVGGGFLGTELAAALAERLGAAGKRVTQVYRAPRPLDGVLPPYLAEEAARRLRAAGVALEARSEVVRSAVEGAGAGGAVAVVVRGEDGAERVVRADAVVECVGDELDESLARASGLEVLGGALAVTAELQARQDVWAAGDAASWYDPALGRRRLPHHDHAVASGRRAGENMAAPHAQRPYDHQPMFWSDLGPDLGYEAIGLVDSRLHTVGVFSAEDAREETAVAAAGARDEGAPAPAAGARDEGAPAPAAGGARRYERGVVFYTRERRVVGVLLWNLFNRMHVARQVLAHGEFDDLFEVAKLFSLHEDE